MKKILIISFASVLMLGAVPIIASACISTDCTTHTIEVVSDTTNTVQGGGNAVQVTYIHPAWTASIPGAIWIWSVDPVANPTLDEFSTFEKQFSVAGDVTSAVLDIASDNSYKVWVNGTLVGEDATEFNYASSGQDQYTAPVAAALHSGTNTIKVEVKNWALADGTITTNPAGLLYKLVVNSKECPPLCCNGDIEVENRNTARVSNNVTVVANTGSNISAGGSATSLFGTANGGSVNGSIITGSAFSGSRVTNTINTNFIRIRR